MSDTAQTPTVVVDPRTKAIIVDLGNVLVDIDTTKQVEEFAKYLPPVDLKQLTALLYNQGNTWQNKLQEAFHQGTITSRDFYNAFMHYIPFEKTLTYEIFINLWPARFSPNVELFKFIKEECGDYKKYLLSDTNELDFGWITQTYKGIFADFDKMFLSYETHIDKLSRKAWEQIAAESKLPPASHIYIDDNPTHVERGEQVGMQGLVFTDMESFLPALRDVMQKMEPTTTGQNKDTEKETLSLTPPQHSTSTT